MARFYVPRPLVEKGMLRIKGEEVKHIRKVLRLREGDEIAVFDGSGKEFEGTIVGEEISSVVIKVQRATTSMGDSNVEVTLAQSLLKGEKMDYLIQKATELGVKEVIPFLSSRSVPVLEKSRRLKRHHRWERIAIEASKQCGRGLVPKIDSLQDYPEMLLKGSPNTLRLLLWEKEGARLKEVLEGSKGRRKIFFIVGPEGGFSQGEVEEAKETGFIPVTLGRRILRAETASLCFLSILQYEHGDIG
ncbi:MAG TPA: 16S rRNA (uracil(1498)-N(3))-methyltransferase [Thermodesulfobacteriota bacterium]|nr:16S rRNA (uracil(1498)-N(3))-methyltransferase [Thermodesulfobacteriota bacterium]